MAVSFMWNHIGCFTYYTLSHIYHWNDLSHPLLLMKKVLHLRKQIKFRSCITLPVIHCAVT